MEESFYEKLKRKCEFVISRLETLPSKQLRRHMRKLCSRTCFDMAFDIGGNAGQFGKMLRGVGYNSNIITFEPIPELVQSVRKTADQAWTVVEMGVGDKSEIKQFNIMKSSPLSSFMDPQESSYRSLSAINTVSRTIQVKLTTLDDYIDENNLYGFTNAILKIDTQGYEMACLHGAENNLHRMGAVIIELNALPLYKNIVLYHEIMKYLHNVGFALSLVTASPPYQFPKLIDFDAVYVRD